jgi:hypothetical protein
MEPKGLLPASEDPAIVPYYKPDESTLQLQILFLFFVVVPYPSSLGSSFLASEFPH